MESSAGTMPAPSPRSSPARSASTTGSGASTCSPTTRSSSRSSFTRCASTRPRPGTRSSGRSTSACSSRLRSCRSSWPARSRPFSADDGPRRSAATSNGPGASRDVPAFLGRSIQEVAMTPVLQAHFSDYSAFHRTPGNQACHYVGIPLIVLSLFALLSRVPLFDLGGLTVTLAEVVLVAATIYYLTLDAALAVMMLMTAVVLFVLGWVFQFVGHYVYEKKSPAFFRNFVHLLVGPLWILAKVSGRA